MWTRLEKICLVFSWILTINRFLEFVIKFDEFQSQASLKLISKWSSKDWEKKKGSSIYSSNNQRALTKLPLFIPQAETKEKAIFVRHYLLSKSFVINRSSAQEKKKRDKLSCIFWWAYSRYSKFDRNKTKINKGTFALSQQTNKKQNWDINMCESEFGFVSNCWRNTCQFITKILLSNKNKRIRRAERIWII